VNDELPARAVVDVAFALQGRGLPRDHAQGLQQALCEALPWLASEANAGVHPIKLVHGLDAVALLSPRSRLLLRLSAQRAPGLRALAGTELRVQGHALRLGQAQARALLPHATLYAYRVAAPNADEAQFVAGVTQELARLGVEGERVCGKRQEFSVGGTTRYGFSLMLHGLKGAHSLLLQQHGLGPLRLLGFGIFVPHKSVAAV